MFSAAASVPVLDFVPPGVRVASSGSTLQAAGGIRYYSLSGSEVVSHSARQPLSIGTSDLTVSVALRPTVAISGRVVWERPSRPETTPTVANVDVQAQAAFADATLGFFRGRARGTDFSRFTVEGLQAGPYLLAVPSAPGVVKSIEWQGQDYSDKPFDASIGRDFTDVVITITQEPATLTGSVRTARGEIADEAVVICFPTDRALWSGFGLTPRRFAQAPVTNDGTFRITNLPAGSYRVIALADADSTDVLDPAFLQAAAPLASRVTLAWRETASLTLTQQTLGTRR
jgi:hypothetical protein